MSPSLEQRVKEWAVNHFSVMKIRVLLAGAKMTDLEVIRLTDLLRSRPAQGDEK